MTFSRTNDIFYTIIANTIVDSSIRRLMEGFHDYRRLTDLWIHEVVGSCNRRLIEFVYTAAQRMIGSNNHGLIGSRTPKAHRLRQITVLDRSLFRTDHRLMRITVSERSHTHTDHRLKRVDRIKKDHTIGKMIDAYESVLVDKEHRRTKVIKSQAHSPTTSQLTAHSSQLTAHSSQLTAHGSRRIVIWRYSLCPGDSSVGADSKYAFVQSLSCNTARNTSISMMTNP